MLLESKALRNVLSLAKSLPRTPHHDASRYLRIVSDGDAAEVNYTNYEIWLKARIALADGRESADEFVVAVDQVDAIARMSDQMDFSHDRDTIIVSADDVVRYELLTIYGYAEWQEYSGQWHTGPKAGEFAKALARVKFCATNSSTRRLDLACVDCRDHAFIFTATDGRRLGRYEIIDDEIEMPEGRFLIPQATFSFLSRLCTQFPEDSMSFAVESNALLISIGNVQCRVLLVEAAFPKVENVFPKQEPAITFAEDPRSLQIALKSLSPCIDRYSRRMELKFSGSKLTLKTTSTNGVASTVLAIGREAKELEMSVCWKMLTEIINAIDDDQLTIAVWNADAPIQITAQNTAYLLMPMLPIG